MAKSAFVQFCDDVREEVGNKSSLIGLYDQEMRVEKFPALLPKFFLIINIQFRNSKPDDTIKVQVELDDKRILEGQIDIEGENETPSIVDFFQIRSAVRFSPFRIEKQSVMKVYAYLTQSKRTLIGQLSFSAELDK